MADQPFEPPKSYQWPVTSLLARRINGVNKRGQVSFSYLSGRHGAFSPSSFFSPFLYRFKTSRFAEPNRFATQRKRGKEENTQSSHPRIGKEL